MDDSQLESELAALERPQAADKQPSEDKPEKPVTTPGEGEEGQSETETDNAETEADAGDGASKVKDETDEGEKTDDDKSDEESDDKPKRKSGVTRLKERLAAAQAEAAALRSRISDSEPTQADVEKLVGKPPKEDDFKGDFLAFERAQTVYEMRKANAEDRLRDQQTQAKTASARARAEAAAAHTERLEEFAEKVPDFEKTIKAASHLKASPIVEDLVLESDKSAHIVYHLAKNPDRLAKLNAMSEREAAREIGRIEARLSLPAPKTQTQASKPKVPPKGGASPPSSDKEIEGWLKKTYG